MTGAWTATINCWDGHCRLKDAIAAVDGWSLYLYGGERPTDDKIEPTCSVKELLEQTLGEKDDKMGTVF